MLYSSIFSTPLGAMIAVADSSKLYFLQFQDHVKLEKNLAQLEKATGLGIVPETNGVIFKIQYELQAYFLGLLEKFETPIFLPENSFKAMTLRALTQIPYATTKSYQELAASLGNSRACRAVGNVNAGNQIAIIIPCHRVITSSGNFGGYSGGIERKQFLLHHEMFKKTGLVKQKKSC